MPIPFIVVELDKTYHLRFGMGAVVAWKQDKNNPPMEDVLRDMRAGIFDWPAMARMLRVMMLREAPGITLDQVCNLMDDYCDTLTQIQEYILRALGAAYADDEAGEVEENPKTPAATENQGEV